ncbi:diacylglycerol/lipid kinase family protein [Virgisporangium aurantiacum]|uniref:DAGKc domain-containing protein n=1 Tax=Virgisporangium aurantiacum TaxID=175570 RepID=A0A8J4E869_9ACTN|nr:diacylglycerol kinase family protein [Virgisporangium aurantiacum]GIJ62502.1 hypothetical protein Vau01_100180 [Virgisporangium aurantiacum]
MKLAVVAHSGKSAGGGGPHQLRELLAGHGCRDPLWFEVDRGRKAGKKARRAIREGAELLVVWGGDGTVQRCLDAAAGTGVEVAIIPAGTANLLATNLSIPSDPAEAVRVAMSGRGFQLDLGRIKGEHFAVMAGAGLDAEMIDDAGRTMKGRLEKAAYVLTALRHVRDPAVPLRVKVDGKRWFSGRAGCVLFGNVSRITGGVRAFPDAVPDDGWLEVGVTTAEGLGQWARTAGRLVTGHADRSPLVHMTRARRRVKVRFESPIRYELDGGDRKRVSRLTVTVVPGAVTVRVPVAVGTDANLPEEALQAPQPRSK